MGRNADQHAAWGAQRGADRLAVKLRGIAEQARNTRSTGLHVPIMDADPADDDPTNLWLLEDGRLRARTADGTIHEYTPDGADTPGGGDTTGGGTSTKPKPADTAPRRFQKTYAATWGRTYCATHGVETGGNLRYGTFPGSAHGMRRIMFGFNDSAIRSDLSGATIRKVELSMRNTDSWYHSGISIRWGAHNRSAAPSGFSAVRAGIYTGSWPEAGYGATWRNVTTWIGKALRDNDIKGLTVVQPTAGATHYGELDWSSLRLRITYTA